MALYLKEPEKPFWMNSLEGLLGSLGNAAGNIGAAHILSTREKQAKIKRKEALAQAGYPEDIADQIAMGGDQAVSQVIQQKYQQQQQQQQNLQYVNAQRMMQGQPPIQMPNQQQQMQQKPLGMLDQLGSQPMQSPQQAGMQRQEQQQMQQALQQQQGGRQPSQEDMIDLAVLYGQMTPQQATKAKLDIKNKEQASQQHINQAEMKDIAKYREKVLSKGKAIDGSIRRLDKLENLSASGELDDPKWASLLNSVGLGKVKMLQGSKTQHYNKIIADFISGLDAMFPGKTSDVKLRAFLERLPTSDLSEDAREDIISDLRTSLKAESADRDAYMELVEKNGGVPYRGIIEDAERLAMQKIDQYKDEVSVLTPELLSKKEERKQQERSEPLSAETAKSDIPGIVGQFGKGFASVPESIRAVVMRNAKEEDFVSPEKLGLNKEQQDRLAKFKSLTAERAPKVSEKIEELAGKPKTAIGKQAGGYAETLGSMLFPLPGVQGLGVAQAAKQAGVGQVAKWASQQVGFGEKGGERFKLVSMILYSLLGRRGPMTEAGKIYDVAEKYLPLEVESSTAPLHEIVKMVEAKYDPNIMSSANSQKIYSSMLDDFKKLIDYPSVAISKVWEFKKKIPEMVKQASEYSASASNPFYKMSNELSNFLKSNPEVPKEASRAIKIGDELWSGYNNVLKTFNTIKDASTAAKGLATSTAALLGIASKPLLAVGAGAAGTAIAGKTGYAFVKELLTNPSIRHHYAKTVQLAAQGSRGPLIKQIAQLNLAVKNQEKKRKKS